MFKIVGAVVTFVLIVIALLFVVQQAWSWVVPDLFPGAVEQGLVAGEISLWVAFKLEILLGLLIGSGRSKSS